MQVCLFLYNDFQCSGTSDYLEKTVQYRADAVAGLSVAMYEGYLLYLTFVHPPRPGGIAEYTFLTRQSMDMMNTNSRLTQYAGNSCGLAWYYVYLVGGWFPHLGSKWCLRTLRYACFSPERIERSDRVAFYTKLDILVRR